MTEDAPDEVFKRITHAYQVLGITKDIWCNVTGHSENQYYRWHNRHNRRMPNARQARLMFENLDVSVAYLWYGVGPIRLSELRSLVSESKEVLDHRIDAMTMLREIHKAVT